MRSFRSTSNLLIVTMVILGLFGPLAPAASAQDDNTDLSPTELFDDATSGQDGSDESEGQTLSDTGTPDDTAETGDLGLENTGVQGSKDDGTPEGSGDQGSKDDGTPEDSDNSESQDLGDGGNLDESAEPLVITPIAPTVQDASCIDGVLSTPSVEPQAQDGVTISIEGDQVPGATVTVRATLLESHAFSDLTGTGWTIDPEQPSSATFSVTFSNPECDPVGESDSVAVARSRTSMSILAVGCGSAPYPAPTGSLITDAIDSIQANPTDLASNYHSFELTITWSLKSSAQGGDYFQLALPDELSHDPLYFELQDPDGNAVACASINDGLATFVLTDFVETHTNVHGSAQFSAGLADKTYTEETLVPLEFAGHATITITAPGDYSVIEPDPSPFASKTGRFTDDDQGYTSGDWALLWTIRLPASDGGYSDVVVSDTAADNWTFSCSTPTNPDQDLQFVVPDSIDYTVTCSPEQLTVTIAEIPANTNVDLWFFSDIETGAPGPFNNTFTGTGFETEQITKSTTIVRQDGEGEGDGDLVVTPVEPTVVAGSCTGDTWSAPTVTIIDGNGLTYIVDLDEQTGDFTVTATKSDYQEWADLSGTGWVVNDANEEEAIYTGHVEPNPCSPETTVVPLIPTVTGNACEGGIYTPPTVVATNGNGVTYTIGAVNPETGAYTVTAELASGQAWGAMPNDWTIVDADTATYAGTIVLAPCTETVPTNPGVTQAVCTGGELITPTIDPATTEGIEYTTSGGEAPGATVLLTATLENGYEWGTLLEGWTRVDDDTATFTVVLDDTECAQIIPAAPVVSQSLCTDGVIVDPIVTLQETSGVTYTMTGDVIAGGTVLITAELANGRSWGDLPEGWTSVDNDTATFTVVLDDVSCVPTVPTDPSVTGNVCEGGVYTAPTVVATDGDGITYTVSAINPETGAYIVTAELASGYTLGDLPQGWTSVDDDTATYTGSVELAPCVDTTPTKVSVVETTCETDPSVTLPEDGQGVTYTITGDQVPGGTVVITATLDSGYAWSEMPDGWTLVDDTTATFTVELEEVSCDNPVTPTPPVTEDRPDAPATPVTEDRPDAPATPVTTLPTTGSGDTGYGTAAWMVILAILAAVTSFGTGIGLRIRSRP